MQKSKRTLLSFVSAVLENCCPFKDQQPAPAQMYCWAGWWASARERAAAVLSSFPYSRSAQGMGHSWVALDQQGGAAFAKGL